MVLSLDNNAIWYCTFLPFIVEENERSCDLWWFHVFSFFLYIFSVSIVAKVTIVEFTKLVPMGRFLFVVLLTAALITVLSNRMNLK